MRTAQGGIAEAVAVRVDEEVDVEVAEAVIVRMDEEEDVAVEVYEDVAVEVGVDGKAS